MKLLLTYFEPFGGDEKNSAEETAKRLPDVIGSVELVKRGLPVTFEGSGAVLKQAIAETAPDAVLCLGQAGGRAAITPEKVAVNWMNARIPDNAGFQPIDLPIRADGPCAYFATLPVTAMTEAVRAAGVKAELSLSAGSYVCNFIMYTLLDTLQTEQAGIPGGFMHLPYAAEQLPENSEKPSLKLDELVRGTEAAIRAIAVQVK